MIASHSTLLRIYVAHLVTIRGWQEKPSYLMAALNLENLANLQLDRIDWQGRQRTDIKDEMETGKKNGRMVIKKMYFLFKSNGCELRSSKELS